MQNNIFDTEILLASYKLFWQYPVITEETFYNQNKLDPLFCGFPWATIIDKNIHLDSLEAIIKPYFKHSNYYTCCQHIYFNKLIPLFKKLGITKIYASHKIKNQNIIDNIEIYPCPLYAVNFEDPIRNKEFINIDYININRPILYSFMGTVNSFYISKIRNKIFNLNNDTNISYIMNTREWHFENIVYSNKQNINKELNITNNHKNNTKIYNNLLLKSRFSLCPSGAGPNSIRLWESMACGSIPVLLADTLELPYNIDWENTIIILPEKDINNIEAILKKIPIETENKLRNNCLKVYNKLKNNFKNS